MIVISAPQGSSLEMGQLETGINVLKMDAAAKGDIQVYCCNTKDVETLDLTADSK